jgi:ComF family protein
MNPVDRVLSLIAPDICLGCNLEGRIVCQDCLDRFAPLPGICYRCGKLASNFRTCPKCINNKRPQHVWLYTAYESLAAELVKAQKFDHKRTVAPIMAQLLNDCMPYFAQQPLITYVPTASSRQRERGFDHAQLIAKELAKLRGWHVAALLVRQVKVRQLGATRDVRLAQLKNAFRSVNLTLIKNRHILLVDDVVTTGATVEACAKVLMQAGASAVDCAVFAYTPKNR